MADKANNHKPTKQELENGMDHLFVANKAGKRIDAFRKEYEQVPFEIEHGKLGPIKLEEFLADCGVSPRSVHQMTDAEAIHVAGLVLGEDSLVEPVTVHRYIHEGTNVLLITPGYGGTNPTTHEIEAQEGTLDWVEIDGDLSVRERWNTALELFYVYHYMRERGLLPEDEMEALRKLRG